MAERMDETERTFAAFCIRHGLVPPPCLQDLEQAWQRGESCGVWDWVAEHQMDEQALVHAMAAALHLPVADLVASALDWHATRELPDHLALRHRVVPLRSGPRTITVATANPFDRASIRAIEEATGKHAQLAMATPTAIRDALLRLYRLEELLRSYLARVEAPSVRLLAHGGTAEPLLPQELSSVLSSPSAARLLEFVLSQAATFRAGAIHLAPDAHSVHVRLWIDGTATELLRLPKWLQALLVSGCKALGKLDPSIPIEQQGRCTIAIAESQVALTVCTAPSPFGEAVHLQFHDPATPAPPLEALALPDGAAEQIRRALGAQSGLVLVAHSGSDRTPPLLATLAAELQRQGRPVVILDQSASLSSTASSRGDDGEASQSGNAAQDGAAASPALLLGELTTAQSADFALTAAQSGVLIVAAVGTSGVGHALRRLLELASSPQLVADSLQLVVAEAWLRQVCQRCTEPYEPDRALLRRFHLPVTGQCYVRGRGCPHCHHTGFSGRLAVYEVLHRSPDLANAIARGASEREFEQTIQRCGVQSLWALAAERVLEGRTTVEELFRAWQQSASGSVCPNCGCEAATSERSVCPSCASSFHCPDCAAPYDPQLSACPNCGSAPTPAAAVAPAANPAPAGPPQQSAPAGARPLPFAVLVVEDQTEMRRLIAHILERSGLPLTVHTAASGPEALDLAEKETPDLIVLDALMPGMNGFTVCERLRSSVRTAFVPVLMLTVLQGEEARTRALLAGTDDFLTKPFAARELVARVRRILQRTYGFDAARHLAEPTASALLEMRLTA